MFALVIFTDNVLHVCAVSDVSVINNKCCVKYGKRNKYAARVLAVHAKSGVLGTVQQYIQNETKKSLGKLPSIGSLGTTYLRWSDILQIRSAKKKNVSAIYIDDVLLPLLISSSARDIFSIANSDVNFFDASSQFLAADLTFAKVPNTVGQVEKVSTEVEVNRQNEPMESAENIRGEKCIVNVNGKSKSADLKDKEETNRRICATEKKEINEMVTEKTNTTEVNGYAGDGILQKVSDKIRDIERSRIIKTIGGADDRELQNFTHTLDVPPREVQGQNLTMESTKHVCEEELILKGGGKTEGADSKDEIPKKINANEKIEIKEKISEKVCTIEADTHAGNKIFEKALDKIHDEERSQIIQMIGGAHDRELQNFANALDLFPREVEVQRQNVPMESTNLISEEELILKGNEKTEGTDLKNETKKRLSANEKIEMNEKISEKVYTIEADSHASEKNFEKAPDKIHDEVRSQIIQMIGRAHDRELQNLANAFDLLPQDLKVKSQNVPIELTENVSEEETIEKVNEKTESADLRDEAGKGIDANKKIQKNEKISEKIFSVEVDGSTGDEILKKGADSLHETERSHMIQTIGEPIFQTIGEIDDRELQNFGDNLDFSALGGDITYTVGDMLMFPLDENIFQNVEKTSKASDQQTSSGKPRIISDEILSLPLRQLGEYSVKLSSGENINFVDQMTSAGATNLYHVDSLQETDLEPVMNSTAVDESENYEETVEPNDEEYVPDVDSSDSDISAHVDEPDEIKSKPSRKRSLNVTLGLNKPGISAPDDADLIVENSSSAPHLKRYFCFYCQKMQAKIARHLETVHAKEEDVKKFAQLPPKNKERKAIIAMLRKKGNHLHNNDKRFNTGKLLVCRRPNERMKKSAGDFLACGNCTGQYARSVIRHHYEDCIGKTTGNEQSKQKTDRPAGNERVVVVSGKKVTARVHEKASRLVRRHVFPYLREDEVVRGIRYDELMILYANKESEKHSVHQHHYQMIRARLRLLGRFLVEIKKIKPNSIKSFADVFVPRHYDATIDAVKRVAQFDEEERRFAHPAVATNLGGLLRYCGDILRSEFIKKESDQDQKRVEDFLKLLGEGYGTSINRPAAETQAQNNRRKKVILPSTDDIKKLYSYLSDERTKYFESLNETFSVSVWKKLAETTLLSLLIFNRRRPGEIERLYVEDFQHYQTIDSIANKDTYAALSEAGKKLARTYVRFEIRGKLGRGVPVLVHSTIFECLELLLHHRENAGISSQNPYLFALVSTDKDRHRYLRACNLMRKYSTESGATIPNTLRATTLRKHLATHCLNLNLSNGQVTDLANFMGHEEKIHKNIYRQPVLQTDIVQMSNILKLAQGIDDESSCESDNNEEAVSDDNGKENRETTVSGSFQTEFSSSSPISARRWTSEQRNIVMNRFKSQLQSNQMPTGREMQKLIDKEQCLKEKNVAQIRSWLHTQKKKLGSKS